MPRDWFSERTHGFVKPFSFVACGGGDCTNSSSLLIVLSWKIRRAKRGSQSSKKRTIKSSRFILQIACIDDDDGNRTPSSNVVDC